MDEPIPDSTTTTAARPVLQAHDVHKSFGSAEVLRGIDLTVHRGEVVCLLGASGSGKSTFLRCINDLEQVSITDSETLHTEGFAAAAASDHGDLAVLDGAVALARTIVDVLADGAVRERIRAEFVAAGGPVDVPALMTAPTAPAAR